MQRTVHVRNVDMQVRGNALHCIGLGGERQCTALHWKLQRVPYCHNHLWTPCQLLSPMSDCHLGDPPSLHARLPASWPPLPPLICTVCTPHTASFPPSLLSLPHFPPLLSLPHQLSEAMLVEYFSVCGPVTGVRVSGQNNPRIAWIEFASNQSVLAALALDGQVLAGQTLRWAAVLRCAALHCSSVHCAGLDYSALHCTPVTDIPLHRV